MNTGKLFREALALLPVHGIAKQTHLQKLCDYLRKSVPHYNWVGFYFRSPNSARELVLGPYSGEPTEHVRIPFGKGVCGQAAESERTIVVQDVTQQSNYISCSADVKAEIVIPIFDDAGAFAAQLDIDSHTKDSFTDADKEFLERLCQRIEI